MSGAVPGNADRGIARRGPREQPTPTAASSWRDGAPPVLPEHRGSFADAEADAAYRLVAGLVAGRDLLDIGCRAGHGTALLAEAGARSALGVDPDPRAVEVAIRAHGDQARFMTAEPLALPLAAGTFGMITCFEVLEGMLDPEAGIAALARLLDADGIMALGLPTVGPRDPASGEQLGESRSSYDWRAVLLERFSSVRLYRRLTCFGALVIQEGEDAPESGGEIADPAWLGADPAEDRSVLAVVSNSAIAELPASATLVGSRDLRAYRDTIAAWEQRARKAEADGAAKHWELVASREAQRRLRKRLWKFEHTPLRKLSRLLRGRPMHISEGPPIRAPEEPPEPWD